MRSGNLCVRARAIAHAFTVCRGAAPGVTRPFGAGSHPAARRGEAAGETKSGQAIKRETMGKAKKHAGLAVLLAVLLAPESHFAKYHANQGLVLFLSEVVVSAIIWIGRYIPLIGWTFQLLNIFIVILFFLGLSHAIREAEEPLPFIGGIEILK